MFIDDSQENAQQKMYRRVSLLNKNSENFQTIDDIKWQSQTNKGSLDRYWNQSLHVIDQNTCKTSRLKQKYNRQSSPPSDKKSSKNYTHKVSKKSQVREWDCV